MCLEKGAKEHVMVATLRNPEEGRRVVYQYDSNEAWKVAPLVRALRDGSLSKAMNVKALGAAEAALVKQSINTRVTYSDSAW